MAAMIKTVAVLSAAVCLACPPIIQAQVSSRDWPQWRGPTRDGAIPTFTVAGDLAGAADAQMEDRRRTRPRHAGRGRRSRVHVQPGRRRRSAGRVRRRERQGHLAIELPRAVHRRQGRARSRQGAQVDAGRSPMEGSSRSASAAFCPPFDAATGKRVWQEPAPPAGPTYTTSQSPIVDRGLLIVHVGGYGKGALTAFDPQTGARMWQWTGDGPAYGSPIVADFAGHAAGHHVHGEQPRGRVG